MTTQPTETKGLTDLTYRTNQTDKTYLTNDNLTDGNNQTNKIDN